LILSKPRGLETRICKMSSLIDIEILRYLNKYLCREKK
jgi:hypothetical protein